MKDKTFLNHERALLTVIMQCSHPETIIKRIRNSLALGAEAYGLQVESMFTEYHNEETYQKLFKEMKNRPVYVTYYRNHENVGKTDEELADGLLTLSKCGATLCDVMGDMFSRHPDELTEDPDAIKKQMELIDQLHANGSEVLMSSHVKRFIPAERVLEIALEQKRRGADIIKIVTKGNNMDEQIENLRIHNLLKKELNAPFLYLSGGVCSIHRRLGGHLGACMTLCVYEHDHLSTASQPLLSTMKTIRDFCDF